MWHQYTVQSSEREAWMLRNFAKDGACVKVADKELHFT